MIFRSTILTQMSGRLNSDVFAHNLGGPYVRALGNPNPNPPTMYQTAMRDAMTATMSTWRDTLTQEQRDAWAEFAAATLRTNRIGVRRSATGYAEFTAANAPRLYFDGTQGTSLGTVVDPPPRLAYPFPNSTLLSFDQISHTVILGSLDGASDWWLEGGLAGLMIWHSGTLPATRRSHRLHWIPKTFINSDSTGTNFHFGMPTATAPEHWQFKLQVYRADGRQSTPKFIDVQAP